MGFRVNRSVTARGWGKYLIMHKDRHVATIREDGSCTVYYPSFMPYSLYLEKSDDLDARLNNLNNFYFWCASRVLTLDRKYAKEILNSIGATQATTDRERAEIAISYHCLSLTDVFWVRSEQEQLQFEEISLYRNSLAGAFVDVSLRGRSLTAENSELITESEIAGDAATSGVAPKAWVKRDGTFYLLKDGEIRDVEAELLASKIADCFKAEHVIYAEDFFDGQKVSRSRLLTSEDFGIVPMEYVEIYCVNHDLDRDTFVKKKDAYGYYMMNIIDYLVGNTDRHWGNWGFLVDHVTNRLIHLHPLMDFNKAFQAYDILDGAQCQTVSGVMSQRAAALKGVRTVGLNQIAEVKREWFRDEKTWEMFCQRLEVLRAAEQS